MITLRIARVLPELLNLNGSLGNSEILAVRARWWEASVHVEDLAAGHTPAGTPHIAVFGHGTSSTLGPAASALKQWHELFHSWREAGTAFVGIGLGGDLLGLEVTPAEGPGHQGLGFTPVTTTLGGTRFSGEVTGVDHEGRDIAGYLNDHTTRQGPVGSPLVRFQPGIVAAWSGASLSDSDGVASDGVWVSALSGPLFSLNPHLADDVLAFCWAAAQHELPPHSQQHREADRYAALARAAIVGRVR